MLEKQVQVEKGMGKGASPAALGPWMDDQGQGPNGNGSLTLEGL